MTIAAFSRQQVVKSSHFRTISMSLYVLAICVFIASATSAQPDKKVPINILNASLLTVIETDSGSLTKLTGDVRLKQEEMYLYCDSAYFFLSKNNVEAFGNVQILQPGSEGKSDYMRYVGNTKNAYMRGNVMLTDHKSHLWSEEVTYNTGTKIGTYYNGGRLQDSSTTLSSNTGVYDMRNKNARFTGNVHVTDPQYNVESEDLGYNTDTKLTEFFSQSVVTSDSSVLKTSCGTYDPKAETAHFNCRSSVLNKHQYVEADTLRNNRKTGVGNANGHVIAIDTSQHTTLYCGRADFNEKRKTILATIKPVMKQINGDDSLFIRADTFYSAPVPAKDDSVKITKQTKRKDKIEEITTQTDTAEIDGNLPRYFIGYHHVLIFSDSMQGSCDSVSFSETDSIMRMMYKPIVWSRKSQMTGDTIYLHMDSGKIKMIYIPNNAFVASRSGPEKAGLFDQIQGKTLTSYFNNNTVRNMLVKPDAQTIYYATDEQNAYIGVNEVSSEKLRAFFNDGAMDNIIFEKNVKQKQTPMGQANLPGMKLSRFQWHEDKRPKTLQELFK